MNVRVIHASILIVALGCGMALTAGRLRAQDRSARADGLAIIGRQSCATSTCHGGPISDGARWNSSLTVFEAYDPHATAGLSLGNELSRQIVTLLDPSAASSPARFNEVLVHRCNACHAPSVASSSVDPTHREFNQWLAEGISCEACHGTADDWLEPHRRNDWAGGNGMLETSNYVDRFALCVRCHVGSRRADGLVRDMNHDLIAAGHPALRFDPWSHSQHLPPHWDEELAEDGISNDDHNTRMFILGRLVSARAAVELTGQRAADAARSDKDNPSVWPELGDYDCYACHQNLRITNIKVPPSPGYPRYNPWWQSGLTEFVLDPEWTSRYFRRVDQLRLRSTLSSDIVGHCSDMSTHLTQRIEALSNAKSLPKELTSIAPFDSFGRRSAAPRAVDQGTDWYDAAIWFLYSQAILADQSRLMDPSVREPLRAMFDQLNTGAATGDATNGTPASFDVNAFKPLAQQLAPPRQD